MGGGLTAHGMVRAIGIPALDAVQAGASAKGAAAAPDKSRGRSGPEHEAGGDRRGGEGDRGRGHGNSKSADIEDATAVDCYSHDVVVA